MVMFKQLVEQFPPPNNEILYELSSGGWWWVRQSTKVSFALRFVPRLGRQNWRFPQTILAADPNLFAEAAAASTNNQSPCVWHRNREASSATAGCFCCCCCRQVSLGLSAKKDNIWMNEMIIWQLSEAEWQTNKEFANSSLMDRVMGAAVPRRMCRVRQ